MLWDKALKPQFHISRLFQEAEDIDTERLCAGHPQQGLPAGRGGGEQQGRLRAPPAVQGEATLTRLPPHAASEGEG